MTGDTLTFLSACARIAVYDYDKMGRNEMVQFGADIKDALATLLEIDVNKLHPLFRENALDIKRKIVGGLDWMLYENTDSITWS